MNETSHLKNKDAVLKYTASTSDDEQVIYSVTKNGASLSCEDSTRQVSASDSSVNTPSADYEPSRGQWTESDMMAKRDVQHPTSNLDVMMHFMKCNVGTGILALPNAMKYSGLAVGVCGLVIVSVICLHCMHLVLKCSRRLCLRTGTASLDYSTTAQYSFSTGPSSLRRYSSTVRFFTNFFLCVTQLGFCCVYFVFVSTNIKNIVERNSPGAPFLDYRVYMVMVAVPIVLLSLLRNLKFLAPASTVANLLQVVSIAIIFYYICRGLPPTSSRTQFAGFEMLPLWFGIVVFAFEGIGLVLPLENSMKRPQDFGGLTGVLTTSMAIVCCLYFAISFYGYLKYGDSILGSITLNLPNEILADVVRAAYSLAILLTYSVQFYVPVHLMWSSIEVRVTARYQYWCEMLFRISLILVTFALASLIPQLGLFISLVGAFSATYLSLILPPVLEVVTYWQDGISWCTVVKDIVIFLIGILGCVTGTYVSVKQIASTFGDYN